MHCQRACLSSATRVCHLVSEMHRLEFCGPFEITLLVNIYQAAQILHHLPHLLPKEDPDSVYTLKAKLSEALQVVRQTERGNTPPRSFDLLKESEILVMLLGQEKSNVDIATRLGVKEKAHWAHNLNHPNSRGSYIDNLHEQATALLEDNEPSDLAPADNGDPGTLIQEEMEVGHELVPSYQGSTDNLAPDSDANVISNSSIQLSDDQGVLDPMLYSQQQEEDQAYIPWDPFDVQLNGYYDPNLTSILFSISGSTMP